MDVNNLIHENMGIILGIIRYITTHYDALKHKIIVIAHSHIRNVVKKLFAHIIFKKKSKNKDRFTINIHNNIMNDLVICYVNSLLEIHATHEPFLLPWYDPNNPIILFQSGKKSFNVKKIKKNISKFSLKRLNWHVNDDDFIVYSRKYHCFTPVWDVYIEYKILNMIKQYFNVDNIYGIVSFVKHEMNFDPCGKVKYVDVPVHIPIYIKNNGVEPDTNVNNCNNNNGGNNSNNIVTPDVQKLIIENNNYIKLLDLIGKKIQFLNDIK